MKGFYIYTEFALLIDNYRTSNGVILNSCAVNTFTNKILS